MRVTVLFFGMLRDITGFATEQIDLAEPACIGSVWQHYAARFPRLERLRSHLRFARNHEFVNSDQALISGDEIAFLPPVSGGVAVADGVSDHESCTVSITRDSIDTRALVQSAQQSSDGAVVTFEGVVRDNTNGRPTEFLEYEGYESMAAKVMRAIGTDLLAKYAVGRIALVHRLGRLGIGEASVVIVVSAPHRKPAFDACFEGINRLKGTVPIWKKEHFAGGEVWVEGAWDDRVG